MSPLPWFRWHVGTVTDIKWHVIATRAETSVANVLAVWTCLLEDAAQAEQRGTVESWCGDDIAAYLGLDQPVVNRIWGAMQGKVLEGQRLTGWNKRQPKREDDSAERMRKHRHNQKVTHCDAGLRTVTQCDSRVEESRVEEIKATTSADGGSEDKPPRTPKSLSPDEQVVLEYYHTTHPRRKTDTKTATRYIGLALKTFSVEELKRAIQGNATDPWHKEHRKHELSYVLRNPEKISAFIEHGREDEIELDEHGDPTYESMLRMVK